MELWIGLTVGGVIFLALWYLSRLDDLFREVQVRDQDDSTAETFRGT